MCSCQLIQSCYSRCPVTTGLQTTVQDWPGRVKLWHVGVPPSGPMDSLHHRLANALVGNPSDAAALEFGLTGPTLRFHCDCTVALTGQAQLPGRDSSAVDDDEARPVVPVHWPT